MERYFRLDAEDCPVRELDRESWARWMVDEANRPLLDVAKTDVGHIRISTIFYGYDEFGFDPPLVWETQIEGGCLDGHTERYSSRQDARLGHERWVQLVRAREELRGLGCHRN